MKKLVHFYKARSRIGITNHPVRHLGYNLGVEDAPDVILSEDFLAKFIENSVSEFTFPKPEEIKKADYINVLVQKISEFKEQINRDLGPNQAPVVIGGDNCITMSSLLALLERVKDISKIGYIQFDSHGDLNQFSKSPSGNFHGMYLRPFVDKFDVEQIESLVLQKFQANQLLFIGDMVLDGDEPELFTQKGFRNISRKEFSQNQFVVQTQVRDFIKRFDYLHVNFDIDVLDQIYAGATGIPEDGKWTLDQTFILLSIISSHPNISVDLSEVNPKKTNAQRTIQTARRILETLLL